MRISKWTLLVIAPVLALACAQKVDSPAASPSAPPERTQGEGDLQIVTSGQSLNTTHWNQQDFLTRTKVDAFRAVYKFNSGMNRSFQIFNLSAALVQKATCPAPAHPPVILLQSEIDDPIEIQEREPVALITDTDYELTILRPFDCDEAQMSLRFLAWMGISSRVTPDVARICQDAIGGTMTFFAGGTPRAYMDPQHPFINGSLYCGQSSNSQSQSCMTTNFNGQEETLCRQGATEADGFAFRIAYDAGVQSLRLQCSLNGSAFDHRELQSCRELILDSALYH